MSNVLEVKTKKYADNLLGNFEDLNKILETNPKMVQKEMGMNRQQFRDMKRDQKKHADNIKGFSVKQEETVRMMLRANEKYYLQRIGDYATAMTASVNAVLHDMLGEMYTKEAATQFWYEANDLAVEHLDKTEGRTMNMEDWVQMEKRVKEVIFKGLDEKRSAKDIKDDVAFKFPKLSKAQVKNAYAEAKEEWEAVNQIADIMDEPKKVKPKKVKKEPKVTMTKEAGEQLEEIVEELKADGKVIDSLGIKISDETSEAMAKVSEELRDVDKRFVEGWGKNAPSVELVEVPEEAQKELAEIEEERYMPTEKQVLSITEQLKGKVELLSAKEQAIEKDIDKCQEEIAKLQLAIEEKRNSIGEVKRKKEVAERMIKDAEILEAI